MELKRENPYKARAYSIAAEAVESVNEEIGRVIDEQRLTQIRGIGESTANQISELYETGQSSMLERLRKQLPPGVIELSEVPGLSVKKIQMLHAELGITGIKELEEACRAGRVQSVRGFGDKTEQNILEGIKKYQTREKAELLYDAILLASRIRQQFNGSRSIRLLETAGSVRRWKETVRNINFVAATTDSDSAMNTLEKFPLVTRTESRDQRRCVVRLSNGMRVSLLCSARDEFPAASLVETGNTAHVQKLQQLAQDKGYTLSEKGLAKGKRNLALETEADIYEHLGLPFIPPELREDTGEIEEALRGGNFDDLIRVDDIRGMTHCHTIFSDGKNTVEEMARAADQLGMQYITITDHSPAAHYAGGLNLDRLKRQWEEIEQAQEKVKVTILRGTESDILEDGSLDYPDAVLEQLDIIIASVHSRMKMDEDQMTKRLINAMKKKQFKIWGHALGRLLLRREPFACRVEDVLDVAAENNVAIEVNGDPYRLDMEPRWIREARKRHIPFIVSVDAHSTGALNYLRYGVHIARRGGLRKTEVLNTLSVEKFAAAVNPNYSKFQRRH